MATGSSSIPQPSSSATIGSTISGTPVPKLARLKIMSDREWEEFIQEWATSGLKAEHSYLEVHRCGGGGDMGRDVVAYVESTTGPYDNYQCKFYDHALHPSDVWLELGKLCYYTYRGEFPLPRRYRFVSPQGAGTSLIRLFEKPVELKKQLLLQWDSHCSKKITSTGVVKLDEDLKKHIEAIDFSMFGAVPPAKLIEEHSKTPFHTVRFGGGLPPRPAVGGPATDITAEETRYVGQLLAAYAEDCGSPIGCPEDLSKVEPKYREHLDVSREEFFSAECLDKFSRDNLPPDSFRRLQEDIHDGVRETMCEAHDNGFVKVKATTKQAKQTPVEGHPLRDVIRPRDKAGICHQLANEDRIRWVNQDDS